MRLKLIVVGGKQAGKEIPVRKPKFLIGRGEGCHLRLNSHMISRKHCLIRLEESSATVEDCGSTNGTVVNGKKIEQRLAISDGDRIKVGNLELEVRISEKAEEKQSAEAPTVEASAATASVSSNLADDDLEISKWLSDDDDDGGVAAVSKPKGEKAAEPEASAVSDTLVGKPTDETTTTMPAEKDPRDKEKKKGPIVGRFKQPVKPKAESSKSAAEEMLRQFFPGKK